MRVDELWIRLQNAGQQMGERRAREIAAAAGKLQALSPLAVLQRGYAVAQNACGEVTTSAEAFVPGEDMTVRFADGAVHATVQAVEKEQLWNRN